MTNGGAPVSVDEQRSQADRHGRAIEKQIRGSSLLMSGRIISMLANVVVMSLTVRALTKEAYGHFSYALSIVTMIATLIPLGIDRAVPRFAAVFDEREEHGKLVGTLLVQLTTILGLGLAATIAVIGGQQWLRDSTSINDANIAVLVVLIVLAPVQALDDFAVALFAVFARPRAIFFRRYLLTPLLRLATVGLLVANDGGARFLAVGYVLTGVAGVVAYAMMLVPLIRSRGIIRRGRAQGVSWPWREVLVYSLPLMVSDVMYAVMNTADVILLNRSHTAEDIAAYRAAGSTAKLNQFVMTSFALLFVPLMARLIERRDRQAMADLYWRTAAWIAVASYPMFALTFSLSGPITHFMFGSDYDDASRYLAVMAIGYYFNAAMGFNGLTVKTAGRVGYTVAIALGALVCNLILAFWLVPPYGAMGASIATLGSLVFHNLLKQLGLRLVAGVPLYSSTVTPIHVVIVVASLALFAFSELVEPNVVVGVLAAAVVSLVVLLVSRRRLAIDEVFPEVLKIPIIGRLLR